MGISKKRSAELHNIVRSVIVKKRVSLPDTLTMSVKDVDSMLSDLQYSIPRRVADFFYKSVSNFKKQND
jgi:hypothetical protein